jgi:hypothetical protein
VAVVWILWFGLAMSLSLPLLNWPVFFVIAGILVASALIFASITISKGRSDVAERPLRHVWGLAGAIGVGILMQVTPLLPTWLGHPIWSAAGLALGQPLAGHLTTDAAGTLLALAKYLVAMGVAVAVATTCVDRRTSGRMMSGLAWLLALFTGMCFLKTRLHAFQSSSDELRLLSDWTNVSLLGVQMGGVVVVQRLQLRWSSPTRLSNGQRHLHPRNLVAALVIIGLFSVPLIAHAPEAAAIPIACGTATLLMALLIDRTTSGLSGVLFVVVLVVCMLWLAGSGSGLIGAPAGTTWAESSGADLAAAARIFRDFRWVGSGAGTYGELIPIYVDAANDGTGLFSAPPKSLSLLVELGIPLTLLIVTLGLVLAATFILTIARNRHDSVEAILACSVLAYLTGCAFTPGISLSFTTMTVAATMTGLGLAQAKRLRPTGAIPLPVRQPMQNDRKLDLAPANPGASRV